MKALIRVIQAVLILVWLSMLALSALLFINARDDGLPGARQWRILTITDSRMAPELSPGDLAVIHMGSKAQPGDAVLCRDPSGMLELTRIIGSTGEQLILKADGTEDSRLALPEEIEGVLAGYISGLAEPFRFLCSLAGIITIAAAGLVLVVLPGLLLRASGPDKRRTGPSGPESPEPGEASRRPRGGYTPRH